MNRTILRSELHRRIQGAMHGWRCPVKTPSKLPIERPSFTQLAQLDKRELPVGVRDSAPAQHFLELLGAINWDAMPTRAAVRAWPGSSPQPRQPYLIAYLMRLDRNLGSMGRLTQFLRQHPELTWLAGFPLIPTEKSPWGFDPIKSAPSPGAFSHVLRRMPNGWLQHLLGESVRTVAAALPQDQQLGQVVAIDTKHILAWVKENNPKAYREEERFDKEHRPAGDPDCRLGCKRRSNQRSSTPSAEGEPAERLGVSAGEFYWGYASGVAACKVNGCGEFVLAELTQTFDKSDVSYFFPLMEQAQRHLGFAPPNGTADAAFDAFYVHEYFHNAGGMAAVPLVERSNSAYRAFAEDGALLCTANLPMFLKGTFTSYTSLVTHQRQRWWCPLLHPARSADACPVDHPKWAKEGCKSTIAASIGARIRLQLDRQSDDYRQIYRQRTVVERINSQAVALGIERPKLRNQRSIANWNSLIYLLINLRALQRLLEATLSDRTM